MAINIFFCNGVISALSACFISEYLYKKNPRDEFILCIEQGTHVLKSYYQIVDLIVEQNKHFKKIVRANVEFRVVSLRNPIKYIQSIIYYRKISKYVKSELDEYLLGEDIVLWAPTTSRLWQFFKKRKTKLNVIEHGLGEYISARQVKKITLKRAVSIAVGRFLCYPELSGYNKIWLCSNAVVIEPSDKVVQINFAKEFSDYVELFWHAYKKSLPKAAQELQSIILRLASHNGPIYFYLPSDEVRFDMQNLFISEQMKKIKIDSNPLFIIKNHPIDIDCEYWKLLEPYGECINIQNEYNCYAPIEFIAIILGIKNIIGSASSALYYLKSWSPEIVSYIYNDYDLCMLTISSRLLKDNLRAAGLLSNQLK